MIFILPREEEVQPRTNILGARITTEAAVLWGFVTGISRVLLRGRGKGASVRRDPPLVPQNAANDAEVETGSGLRFAAPFMRCTMTRVEGCIWNVGTAWQWDLRRGMPGWVQAGVREEDGPREMDLAQVWTGENFSFFLFSFLVFFFFNF